LGVTSTHALLMFFIMTLRLSSMHIAWEYIALAELLKN